ncbi:uncharacterized protein EV154DRAFT_536088 [Mucor mucedo]|uniref:uncharacterized protein n=1 Tax=Mucor mucedo TaxID=29922 RepID=UPI00221E59EE|nr:uncharacterized protein EV154DRAFT_536088 [Mucor mucedo]KAI7895509.1 hypothetical protein EV154DRAFT_536088 [Mucor mucedo]
MQLTLKTWDDNSVEMNVTHCGICGSDIHTLDENWRSANRPLVGKNVTNLKVGDRAGVCAQSSSCHECELCLDGQENMCQGGGVFTYDSRWPCGSKSYGGYADKWRGDYRFAFKVPDTMTSEIAATFFCAGVTTYAPLKRSNIIPGKSVVGIMGIGGLGHFGVQFAKGLGAKVIGISHNENKRDIALELGCDGYINASDEASMAKYNSSLTHILCTGASPDFQWHTYFALLKVNGHFINVNVPEWQYPGMSAFTLLSKQIKVYGSGIGSPREIEEMLAFAAEKDIKPWITTYKMSDVNKAIEDFRAGKPRFRFVLEN